MQEQDGLTPADRELEMALRSVAPAGAQIDSVAAAFTAGQRSVRGQLRLWQSAAAALVIVAAGSWMVPATHNSSRARPDEYVAMTGQSTEIDAVSEQSVLKLRETVRVKGLDSLPEVRLAPVRIVRGDEVL
jgi:hypothetical protein